MIDWNDLVFTRFGSRSPWRALAYTVASVAAAMALVPGLLRPYPAFAKDGHMRTSYTQAFGSAFCHSRRFSNRFEIVSGLDRHPDWLGVPIAEVVEREAGSMHAYCASLTIPVVNNENSLQLVMRAILFANPRISTAGLGATAAGIRVFFVAVLCFALFLAGGSLLIGFAAAVLACCVLGSLAPYQYGQSPFVFAAPVLLIATCVLIRQVQPSTSAGAAAAFVGFALIAVFCVNMRTSQVPGVLALASAVFVTSRRRTLMTLAVFVVAAGIAEITLVHLQDDPGASGLSYHSIAHAVVLALAVPPSALSAREGIEWDDASGLKIAERLEPGVRYLSGDYERTLWRYYESLWRSHPFEMLGIYEAKLSLAGAGVLAQAAETLNHRWMPRTLTAWLGRRSIAGMPLLAAALATIAGGWALYRRTGSPAAFALLLLALFALTTIAECALVLPQFYVFYHGMLLFYVLMVPVALLQVSLDAARSHVSQSS